VQVCHLCCASLSIVIYCNTKQALPVDADQEVDDEVGGDAAGGALGVAARDEPGMVAGDAASPSDAQSIVLHQYVIASL